MNSKVKITDDIEIDLDYLPLDIIIKFLEIYSENIDEKALSNMVMASIYLMRILDKTDLFDDILEWAVPNPEEVKKKVKTKYKINIYLGMFARIEDYLSIKDVTA